MIPYNNPSIKKSDQSKQPNIIKMKKKNYIKTENQKLFLQSYYEECQGDWPRQELSRIASASGLTEQRVYKWLWDRRHKEQPRVQECKLAGSSRGEVDRQELEYEQGTMTIPIDYKNAVEFTVDISVSVWARRVLKSEGWQLVMTEGRVFESLPWSPVKSKPSFSKAPYHTRQSQSESHPSPNSSDLKTPQQIKLSRYEAVDEEDIYVPFFKHSPASFNLMCKEEYCKEEYVKKEDECKQEHSDKDFGFRGDSQKMIFESQS